MNHNFLPHTIAARQMRQVNRSAILELIRQGSPIARSEISRLLKLSMPTIIRIVDELIEDGLVRSTGVTAGAAGRPRELLEYDKNGSSVIGIDLGGTRLYGALANIGGEILEEIQEQQNFSTGEQSYLLVKEMIHSLIRMAKESQQKLLGVAVGVPGVTHFREGVVEWAPSLDWRNFPLKQRLEGYSHVPVLVENDVNLAVLGEQWFGTGKGVNNMVLLALGTGMGAGLIIDGALYRGHNESAGEVGYMVSGIEMLGQKYDGFGAMESIVSGTAVAERARKLLQGHGSKDQVDGLTAADVFAAARVGEGWARQVVEQTADHLSLTIINIASLLDPELIVLGGWVASSGDLLIPAILQRIQGVIPHVPRIEASVLGTRATVMGATCMTVHRAKDYYVIRRLS